MSDQRSSTPSSPSFALIGAAGFVAPRHMKAIKALDGNLVCAFDPNDSVGVIDSYYPTARFFVEFERFDRHVDKLRRQGQAVDFVSVCSPNYLHDAHIRFALRSDADAICEKPLVLNPWNIDGLAEIEAQSGRRINTILQLRLHPAIIELKQRIEAEPDRQHAVDLTYITSRGAWYHVSWKGDERKSGGIATNIGVHFFDMLGFVFGACRQNTVHLAEQERAAGYMEFDQANVRWFLSVDSRDLPDHVQGQQPTYRSITVDGEEVEFSGGFAELHNESYRRIVGGEGFGLADVRPSIELVSNVRSQTPSPGTGERHPFARRYL
ncbi:MAG: Gfo/Idh/MocA family oxidoreductase [Geminicoccaceae bacterium]